MTIATRGQQGVVSAGENIVEVQVNIYIYTYDNDNKTGDNYY